MKTRTVLYNSSLCRVVETFKLQVKVKNKWKDFRTHGIVKSFSNEFHANNYGKLLNPKHQNYERSNKKSAKSAIMA